MPGDGPGPHLILTNGEKTSQIKQGKGTTNDAFEGALGESEILPEDGGFAFRQLSHLHFQLASYHHDLHLVSTDVRRVVVFVGIVHDHQQRFGGQEGEPAQFRSRCQFGLDPQGLPAIQELKAGFQQFPFRPTDLLPFLLFDSKLFQALFNGA